MKRILVPVLLALVCLAGSALAQTAVSTQTPEPTQTPYIIYVVVTATPEPETDDIQIVHPEVLTPETADNDIQILRPAEPGTISLANDETGSGEVSLVNGSTYATTVDELVQRVISTVVAETSTTAAGGTQNTVGTGGGALVHLSDGTTCTMNFELVNEPTYPAGAIIPRGEVFWKEWNILNTGTCTWTPEWEFVFDSGWQIGNTRFHMNRTTPPGSTLNVRLAMVPDQQQDGNYYSTYVFEAPDGTRYGTITSSYTVKPASYFAKPTPSPKDKMKPQPGRPAGPNDCGGPNNCPPPPPPPPGPEPYPYPYPWW